MLCEFSLQQYLLVGCYIFPTQDFFPPTAFFNIICWGYYFFAYNIWGFFIIGLHLLVVRMLFLEHNDTEWRLQWNWYFCEAFVPIFLTFPCVLYICKTNILPLNHNPPKLYMSCRKQAQITHNLKPLKTIPVSKFQE